MSWPVNPTNGQQTTINGIIYEYDSAIDAWNRVASTTINISVARTVSDNAQPNITSVGTLTGLVSSGNIQGDYFIGNGYYLSGISGGGGTSYANTDVAAYLPINTSNVKGNYIIGNGATLSSLTGANVTGYVPLATAANRAGTVTTAAQPNITSVGTLSTLTVTGNINSGNVSGTYVTGTLTTNAQHNITSLGTLTGITSTGYANLGTMNITGVITATNTTQSTGTGTGALKVAGGVSITKDLWVGGTIHAPNLDVTTYNQFTVDVPLIYLEANTTYPYSYDIGFYSQFTGGAGNNYQHTGLVRNHSDNAWYLFSNIAAEPTGGTVDLSSADIVFDTIKLGNVITSGNLTVNGSVIGNLIPATNELQDLGTDTHRWRDLYLSGNTLKIGGAAVNVTGNTLTTSNFSVTDTVTASNVTTATITSTSGNLTDLAVSANLTTEVLAVANGITANSVVISANVETSNVVATGNVTSSNVVATGNVTSSNVVATGNVTSSNVVVSGNVTTSNVVASGNISVTGNASLGNVNTTGVTSTTLNISSLANISNANITTLVTDTVSSGSLSIGGNANINAATITSMIGNIVGGNSVTSNNLTINDIASILTAQITTLTANTSTSNNLTINQTATIANISANTTTSNNITINQTATIANISANLTTSNNITINQTATIANISANLTTSNNITINDTATIDTAAIGTIDANVTTSNNITINDTATIDTADITTADIVSLTINEATSNSLVINNVANIGSANIGNAEITGTISATTVSGGTGTFSGLITATGGGIKLNTIYDSTGTATITTRYSGYSGDVGITGNLTVGTGGTGKVTTTSLTVTGTTILKQSQEGFVAKTGATGVVAHDFSTGTTFYHTSIAGNFTCNITNLDTTASRATVIVLILAQGSTPYVCNGLQIGGTGQTIKWVNATTPTGTASRVEAIVFTIFNNSGTYTVLGQLSSYG